MKYDGFGFTHVGRREQNEDSLWYDSELGVFSVADGMGGHKGGALASRLAVASVADVFSQARNGLELTWPVGFNATLSFEESLLDLAMRTANRSVCNRCDGQLKKMGTTLAVLVLRDSQAIVSHVGDSRVYRLRDGLLEQLTEDHSLYNELLQGGAPNLPPKKRFPMANVITRAIGRPSNAEPDTTVFDVEEGDTFLLCTDGLSEVLEPDFIATILELLPPEEAAKSLVLESFSAGSRDNITALVVKSERSVYRGRVYDTQEVMPAR